MVNASPLRVLLLVCLCLFTTSGACAAAPIADLRVGSLVAPLGLDDPRPQLSWRMTSTERGAAQSAYRVLVATTAEALSQDRGDLWDSGVVASAESPRVAYAGAPLRSSQQVFWKVKLWDERGADLGWSAPATWTTGVLAATDWHPRTRWISDAELIRWQRAHLGYRSLPGADAADRKWVQLDLGAPTKIDLVRLRSVAHTVDENLGFPRRYQLEVADRADFSDARVVVPASDKDFNAWLRTIELPLTDVTARYLRFTATKLRVFHGEACLAFSQIEVLAGGKNIAPAARLTASDSLENNQWSLAAAHDGLGVPGANPRASDTLRLRREFDVKPALARALLHVSGLGHYTLAVNGAPVDAGLLTPGWSDYRKTCLYDTLDVTARLRAGRNALGLVLAGGMYNVAPGTGRYSKLISDFRPLKAFAELRLEYADGTVEVVSTDDAWKVSTGPTTFAHIYGGEDFDARLDSAEWTTPGYDDRAWRAAAVTSGPGGELRGAAWGSPAFAAHESFSPVAVKPLAPGVFVYDFGQNTAMMPRLRVRGPAGAVVRMTPAELVKADGSVDRGSVGSGKAYWSYTLRGDAAGESWSPSFFYQGARYLQVELTAPTGGGLPTIEKLESVVTHSASPPAGTFATSNELFNRIHALVRWAQRSNLAHVLSDCPHREKLGWLEQYHLNGPSMRYEWDASRLFAKGFNDMADAQRANGHIPSIAPEYVVFDGGFVDSPEWGSALILAGWQHYLFTGDDAPLRRHYGAMGRYLDYLTSRADGHIVSHGLGDWYDIGPNRPGIAQLTPIALTATAIYYEDARALAQIARLLGRDDDARRHDALAEKIATAFNARFLDATTGVYATGSQTSQAMPLVLGLVPPAARAGALAVLLRDVEQRGYAVTAGDVGYRYLLRALADAGRSDVIYKMVNQSDKPGYGYQLAQGATALTEAWNADPRSSQNHFMLGQVMEWFYQDLAGLGVDPEKPGFKNVIVRPQPVGDLTWAEASHVSPYGKIAVRWERSADGRFTLRVEVPANSTATVHVPTRTGEAAIEGGSAGVVFLRRDGDRAVYQVAAGRYVFTSRF